MVGQLRLLTGDLASAEDIAQEAFVRAASRWRQLVRYDQPEAWVRKTAFRLAIDLLRRAERHQGLLVRLGARQQEAVELPPRGPCGDRGVAGAAAAAARGAGAAPLHRPAGRCGRGATRRERRGRSSRGCIAAGSASSRCCAKRHLRATPNQQLSKQLRRNGMPSPDLPGLNERLRQLPATLAVGPPAGLAERIARRGRRRRWRRRAAGVAAVAAMLAAALATRAAVLDHTPTRSSIMVSSSRTRPPSSSRLANGSRCQPARSPGATARRSPGPAGS
jgi:Sigma-70 region 2